MRLLLLLPLLLLACEAPRIIETESPEEIEGVVDAEDRDCDDDEVCVIAAPCTDCGCFTGVQVAVREGAELDSGACPSRVFCSASRSDDPTCTVTVDAQCVSGRCELVAAD